MEGTSTNCAHREAAARQIRTVFHGEAATESGTRTGAWCGQVVRMANERRHDGVEVEMENEKRHDGEGVLANACGGSHDHRPEKGHGGGFGSCSDGRDAPCQHGRGRRGGVAAASCPYESNLRLFPFASCLPPVDVNDPSPCVRPPISPSELASSPAPLPSAGLSPPSPPSCESSAPPASLCRKRLLRCSRCACRTREPFSSARLSSQQQCRACLTA